MTQLNQVRLHLEEHKSITSLEAINLYGATRLSAIIYDLRHKNDLKIETIKRTTKNRYGNTVNYAEYTLKGAKNND